MTVIVAGTVRVPPENLEGLRPHAEAVLKASRAEDGCIVYSYGVDVLDPGLIRVFEVWRDEAALTAHFQTPHMAAWREAGAKFGLSGRDLKLFGVASEKAL